MNDNMSKASVCSIVSLDIIDYSVKSEPEKLALKTYFNSIINQAVADIPTQDRIIVEAVNGVAIACNGPLEDAMEDALFISLTARDEILKHNEQAPIPLYVQIGINHGAVLMVYDADGKPSLTGDGLEDAQRVMCFANPNQILVTRAYYEKASQLTREISQMFDKYDMHTLEHDVYAVRLLRESVAEDAPTIPADISDLKPLMASRFNWKYVSSVMFGLLVFFVITKVGLEPTEPTITLDEPFVTESSNLPKSELALDSSIGKSGEVEVQSAAESAQTQSGDTLASQTAMQKAQDSETSATQVPAQVVKKEVSTNSHVKKQNKVAQQSDSTTKLTMSHAEKSSSSQSGKNAEVSSDNNSSIGTKATEKDAIVTAKNSDSKSEKSATKEKSGWESFKAGLAKGAERNCTQGEIALNQCSRF